MEGRIKINELKQMVQRIPLILIVANRLQTRLQTCLETGLQNKLQNGLFLFKIQLGTPQNIANEQLKH